MNFSIRRMARGDLDRALEWAAAEGWNPGLADADPFYQTDPQGFFVGEVDGVPIGSISNVAYDGQFAFLGLYIVRPEFRGQGYGLQLWKSALEHSGRNRNVGLDGVLAQQANYARSGFRFAHRNIRHQGIAGGGPMPAELVPAELVPLSAIPPQTWVDYDAQLFPARRPRFLQAWLAAAGTVSWGLLRNGRPAGYGVLRPCRQGFKIGPLFADDEGLAEILYQGLTSSVPGAAIYLDTPEPNPAAMALARRHGMEPVFETARMYTLDPPALPLSRIFGITTLELG